MRHGYTNRTDLRVGVVRKTYAGPDAHARCAAEVRALTVLSRVIPVPAVVSSEPGVLTMAYVLGEHGQELIDAGRPAEVLASCGALLRRLHQVDPEILGGGADDGEVRHGDFGPNNVLLDPETMVVTALLDWEFSGVGPAIDDIAWCEWVVRMHHPDSVNALPSFFDAYGSMPAWEDRKTAMLRRCQWLEGFSQRWEPGGPGVRLWRARAAETAEWGP